MYLLCQIITIVIIIIIIDFNDWASWPVPVQNLLSENYETIQAFDRTLGRGFAQRNGSTYTGQNQRKKKRVTHPGRDWDSKTRAQCSIGRTQYVL
jgi:hypothetical protein